MTKHRIIRKLAVSSLAGVFILGQLVSCRKITHEQWQQEADKYAAQHITKFHYEGHYYLMFQKGQTGVAMTHDENCPCRNIPAAVGAFARYDSISPCRTASDIRVYSLLPEHH